MKKVDPVEDEGPIDQYSLPTLSEDYGPYLKVDKLRKEASYSWKFGKLLGYENYYSYSRFPQTVSYCRLGEFDEN